MSEHSGLVIGLGRQRDAAARPASRTAGRRTSRSGVAA
jgi:hypothetical protein